LNLNHIPVAYSGLAEAGELAGPAAAYDGK
jgi:hypothetical protein